METSTSALIRPISSAESWMPRFAVGSMVFLGGFLAFSMEPIVGRLVAPFFGGAVHVWTVSLMIFQAMLLAGYLYAHLVAPQIGAWHLLLLLLPLLQLPLGFTSEIASKAPVATLTVALLSQISMPFAVLSTTSVVGQSWWYGASCGIHRSEPFFLYGTSNLGAMAALFVYPFLVEPLFGLVVQRWVWSVGYLLYAGITAWTFYLLQPRNDVGRADPEGVPQLSKLIVLRWLVLSAAPSALLLATTNVIAMEVGSFPMVWVFPLALYLASFIITFRDQQGHLVQHFGFWQFEIAVLALLAARLTSLGAWMLPVLLLSSFALCAIANGHLYHLRPHPSRLTGFYLTIAVGGCLGGILVSLVAPLAFSGLEEYPVAALAIVAASLSIGQFEWWKATSIVKGGARLAFLMIGCTVFGMSYWYTIPVHSLRNFYGISRIYDRAANGEVLSYRSLSHGSTVHGLQYLDPSYRLKPLGYYYVGGALEQAVSLRNRTSPAAMIGLGAGDALAWFGAGEDVTVFEIDPDMEVLARNWFSYLKETPAQVTIRVGDARLNLVQEAHNGAVPYGVVFIDAFSGDAIPLHLLTQEALDVYLSRLAEDGLLVFHVSNRYYDLRPILKTAARARGLAAASIQQTGRISDGTHLSFGSSAIVIARRPELLAPLLSKGNWSLLGVSDGIAELRLWTDDYVNILAPLLINWIK